MASSWQNEDDANIEDKIDYYKKALHEVKTCYGVECVNENQTRTKNINVGNNTGSNSDHFVLNEDRQSSDNYYKITTQREKDISNENQTLKRAENQTINLQNTNKAKYSEQLISFEEKSSSYSPITTNNLEETTKEIIKCETDAINKEEDNNAEVTASFKERNTEYEHVESNELDGTKVKDNDTKHQQQVAEMLTNGFKMRTYIILVGIDVFGSKPGYRPDVNFKTVKYELTKLLDEATKSYVEGNLQDVDRKLLEAEELYSQVAIVLPQASMRNSRLNNSYERENVTHVRAETSRNVDALNNSTSYQGFVRGDDIDVQKALKVAEAALECKDFKKAEKFIKKSQRIYPTKNAQELLKRVEAAKLESERTEKEITERESNLQANHKSSPPATHKARLPVQRKDARQQLESEAARLDAQRKSARQQVISDARSQSATVQAGWETTGLQKDPLLTRKQKDFDANKGIAAAKDDLLRQTDVDDGETNQITKQPWERVTSAHYEYKESDFNKKQAQTSLQIAQEAMNNSNFEKSQKFLQKAKRLDPDLDIEELNAKIMAAIASRSSTVKNDHIDNITPVPGTSNATSQSEVNSDSSLDTYAETSALLYQSDAIQACIKKAQEYFVNKDYDKSLRLLIKANRMSPDEQIQSYIEFVQNEKEIHSKNECQLTHNKEEAEKCVKKADDAYVSGQFDEAERLYIKANRMEPSDKINDLLNKVKTAKEKKSKETVIDISEDEQSNNGNEDSSEMLVNLALKSKAMGHYYSANMRLEKAYKLNPNEETKKIIGEVQHAIKTQSSTRWRQSDNKQMKHEMLKEAELKNAAEDSISKAIEKIQINDYDNAKSFITKAGSKYPIGSIIDDLLRQIWDGKIDRQKHSKRRSKHEEHVDTYTNFKAIIYKEIASRAMKENLYLAEHYLIKSLDINNTVESRAMLTDVREAMKRNDQGLISRLITKYVVKPVIYFFGNS